MATITDLDSFVSHVRMKLGEPVIQVELTDTQIETAILDSIDIFQRYAGDEGNYEDYLVMTLSADVDEYDMTGLNILHTIDFRMSKSTGGINVLFSPTSILASDILLAGGMYNNTMSNYHSAMLLLEEIENTFGKKYRVDYRPGSEIMRVTPTPDVDYIGVLIVYKRETSVKLYNNPLLKDLAVSKTKVAWGEILSKHSFQLPGGSTINGDAIISRGKEEEEKALEAIKSEAGPPGFFIQ